MEIKLDTREPHRNHIGDKGAKAIINLVQLTSLNMNTNQIWLDETVGRSSHSRKWNKWRIDKHTQKDETIYRAWHWWLHWATSPMMNYNMKLKFLFSNVEIWKGIRPQTTSVIDEWGKLYWSYSYWTSKYQSIFKALWIMASNNKLELERLLV